MATYTEDRVRRLRVLLLVVVAVGVVLTLLAVWAMAADGADGPTVASLVAAFLLVFVAGAAVALLRGPRARLGSLVTGGLCVLAGIGGAGSWLSLVLPLLGLGLLFLALVPDEEPR